MGEIGDFGLARRVLDQALAAGKHRGHERVVGCADRDLRQFDATAGQTARGARIDVAAVEIDLGAERFQRGEVKIDGARSDRAAAGQRNARLAAACNQRREHPEARPHARHHLVGRGGIDDLRGGEAERLAVARALVRPLAGDGDVDAVIAENAGKQVHVGKTRHVVQSERLAREKARDH